MRTVILLILAAKMTAQCPSAAPVNTTTCKSTSAGHYEDWVYIAPVISFSTANTTFTWTLPDDATVVGQLHVPKISTKTPGVYTLTAIDGACEIVSTHTVTNCPPGTPMV